MIIVISGGEPVLVRVRGHEVGQVGVGVGAVVNSVGTRDSKVHRRVQLVPTVVIVGGNQAGGILHPGDLLFGVVVPNRLFIERIVIGEDMVAGVEPIAGDLNAQRVCDR